MLLTFRGYELDTQLFALRCAGATRQVEPQVFNLLLYLVQHRERIVSRQELLDALWAGKVVTESTLSSCIKAARQAVGDSGEEQHCIATVHRRGYRFVAPLEQHEAAVISAEGISAAPASHPEQDRPTLAVLPFSCSQRSDAIAWISQVMSEEISIRLARIPGFLVISRNSTGYYRGREYTITQVGQELGTDYVVEGSVWEIGNQLRIAVQLLETTSGRFLWADRNVIPADRLAEFQDEVVREIAGRIEPELNRAEFSKLKQRRPVDLGAWALYRQAHATLGMKGWSEESLDESAALLRQAIARDPELAFAHAYLALTLALGHLIGLITQEGCCEEARAAAETALALDSQDTDVLGYCGCAFVDMNVFQRGIALLRRALELDPSNAQAHAALGAALLRSGNAAFSDEGIEELRHGIRISPRDNRLAVWGAVLARGLLRLGKVDEAITAATHACRSDDKIFLPRLVLAVAENTAGNPQAARAALDDAHRIRPRLTLADIAHFASPDEIEHLRRAGLV